MQQAADSRRDAVRLFARCAHVFHGEGVEQRGAPPLALPRLAGVDGELLQPLVPELVHGTRARARRGQPVELDRLALLLAARPSRVEDLMHALYRLQPRAHVAPP